MEIESKFEHFCRICTIEHEVGIMIFSEEGEKMMLRDKITKYLHIEITTQDRLPKMICINCCTRLDSVKTFSEMALQSQQKLNKHLEILDLVSKNNVKNPSRPPVIHRYKYFQNSDKELNGDSKYQEDESDITEMELRLDPMMFLDCQTDESQSDDSFSDTSLKEISCKSEIPDLCSIEDQCEALTIELLPRVTTFKSERDKKVKALPDLKPIHFTKKFPSLPDPIKKQNASTESCGLKPFVCAVCPRSFLSSIALQNHSWLHLKNKAKEHPGNGRVACPVCKKDISTKGNLKVHMETHRPKGKYNCEICGRIFKTQSNLYRHREYHGGEVFTCTVCGRVYPTNSTLRAHSITHSDARPHNCPLCKKTFKRNQDLKFHINQHTGARPYHCPYCPKAFASSGNCFSHRKRMHPVEVERDRDKSS